jgi:uncharacterized protein (DUF1501 family)
MDILRRNFLSWMAMIAMHPTLSWASGISNKYLILVELKGANDGINTLVPYEIDNYQKLRPNLHLKKNKIIDVGHSPLVGRVGLADSMSLIDKSISDDLAMIQGVGYPGQNRSHFKSIAIWETGGDGQNSRTTGWLTNSLEKLYSDDQIIAHGASLKGYLGLFARGSGVYISMARLNQLSGLNASDSQTSMNALMKKIIKKKIDLSFASKQISQKLSNFPASKLPSRMPYGNFSAQLTDVLRIIGSETAIPVMHVQHGSFDTHDGQKWQHPKLLSELTGGLASFRKNLINMGRWDDVLVMTYSEFGRRVAENGAQGTDHGTASVQFVMGGKVNAGLYGDYPSLDKLEDGDLIHTMDYRSVYEHICSSWLNHKNNEWHTFSDKRLSSLIS